MKLIDTHCHLYSEEFKPDIDIVMQRAESEGVERFYLPAIDSESLAAMLAISKKYPDKCIPMMGLHPCYVKENYLQEVEIVNSLLAKEKFAAVGEIGLDVDQQYDAFRVQIELSLQHNLPVILHTRDAMQETIDVVKEYVPKGIKGIFHCFGGSYENALEIIDAGFYLGIGGVLTYKKSGLDKVLEKIDLQHLVLETDAPYLSPVPFRGKRNESSYLKYIAAKLAEVKNTSIEEVAAITSANAEKIFAF
jgi:TatD DNase family protein